MGFPPERVRKTVEQLWERGAVDVDAALRLLADDAAPDSGAPAPAFPTVLEPDTSSAGVAPALTSASLGPAAASMSAPEPTSEPAPPVLAPAYAPALGPDSTLLGDLAALVEMGFSAEEVRRASSATGGSLDLEVVLQALVSSTDGQDPASVEFEDHRLNESV